MADTSAPGGTETALLSIETLTDTESEAGDFPGPGAAPPALDDNMSSLVGPDGRPLPANGVAVTVVLMLNNVIGSWILGVPATFKGPGLAPCLAMLLLLTLLSRVNSFVIQRMALRTGTEGLEDMVAAVYGAAGSRVMGALCIPLYLLAHLSYVLVGSDTLMKWLELAPRIDQSARWFRPLMLVAYAAVPIAGTVPPQISFLSRLVPVSIGSIFLLALGLSIQAIIDFTKNSPRISPTVNWCRFTAEDLFVSLSVHSGTMTLPGAQSAPLKAYVRNIGKQERVLTLAYVLCYIIYCVPSTLIYLDKGNEIKSNVLMSFDPKNVIIIIIQVGVVLKVTMTFVGLQMIYQIWVSQMVWGQTKPPTAWKRAILMVLTYAAVLGGALVLTDLLPVLGIAGALGLVGMYVLAPLAELKEGGWHWKEKQGIFDIILIIIGVFTTIVSLVFSIKSAVVSLSGDSN
jgi:hypothetical protein